MAKKEAQGRETDAIAKGLLVSLGLLFVGTWIMFGAGWAFMGAGAFIFLLTSICIIA